jgi:hypothetical protein
VLVGLGRVPARAWQAHHPWLRSTGQRYRLVRDGLASAEPIQVQGKRPTPADFYLRVSDAGRKALARQERRKGAVRLALLLFVIGLLAGVCVAAFLISRS